MDWSAVTAIATVISMVAFVLTALYVRAELKSLEKDRYLAITNELFSIWQTNDFMHAQLWLLHRLQEDTWQTFVAAHRGDVGEASFYRVGAFYDRVGTLVRLGFVRQEEILPTVGAYAVAVWQKIRLLVGEARRLEHATLFADFERLLPACRECYVPVIGADGAPDLSPITPPPAPTQVARITVAALALRLNAGEPITLVDARSVVQRAREPSTLPGAIAMPAEEVAARSSARSSARSAARC